MHEDDHVRPELTLRDERLGVAERMCAETELFRGRCSDMFEVTGRHTTPERSGNVRPGGDREGRHTSCRDGRAREHWPHVSRAMIGRRQEEGAK